MDSMNESAEAEIQNEAGSEPAGDAIKAFDEGDFFQNLEKGGRDAGASKTQEQVKIPDGYIPRTELEQSEEASRQLETKLKMMEWKNAELQNKLTDMSYTPYKDKAQPQQPQQPQTPRELADRIPPELRPYLNNEHDKKIIETMLKVADHSESSIMKRFSEIEKRIEENEMKDRQEAMRVENMQNFQSALGRIYNSLSMNEDGHKSIIRNHLENDPDIVRLAENPEWQKLPSNYRWAQMENLMSASATKAASIIKSIEESAIKRERDKIAGINTGNPNGAMMNRAAMGQQIVTDPLESQLKKRLRGEISMEEYIKSIEDSLTNH